VSCILGGKLEHFADKANIYHRIVKKQAASLHAVIPAKAGIHFPAVRQDGLSANTKKSEQQNLDSRFRGNDDVFTDSLRDGIRGDDRNLEKEHLYYRPVFAFEFVWTTEDKVGVIEVNGLTGEVSEDGQWFKDKLGQIATREMLFEAGGELAGVILPGSGFAVKVIERITAPPKE
jgi:hypothetical protein